MKINANEIKVGMLIEYKDDLWEILKTQHVKPGKGGAFCQVEMKSINKNTKLNERFRSNDTIEKASIENIEFNYLYEDEINYYFINQKNFEQVDVKKDIIGEKGKLLKENLNVDLIFHEDKAIGIELPNHEIVHVVNSENHPYSIYDLVGVDSYAENITISVDDIKKALILILQNRNKRILS